MRQPLARGLAVLLAVACLPGCGDPDDPPSPEAVALPRVGQGAQPRFGYSDALEPGSAEIGRIAGSGADAMRRLLSWPAVEPERGSQDWSTYDALYGQLLSQGVRPLWAVTSAPCWAAAIRCDRPRPGLAPAPEKTAELAAFVAEVAQRYPESLAIEVGNEENLKRFWLGGVDPRAYARLLGTVAAAVEAVDPAMPVIAGGLSPLSERTPAGLPWRRYLAALVDTGVTARIDAVGFHPYAAAESARGAASAVERELGRFRAWLDDHGEANLPVWVTEVGLTTAGVQGLSPAEQARGLVRIYEDMKRAGVPVILIHTFSDGPDPPVPGGAGYGVLEIDGTTPKPAYCALAAVRGKPC